MPAKPYSWRFALPRHYLITLAVALVILWGLIEVYGRRDVVLIGWLAGFLIASRLVGWLVARRKARDRGPSRTLQDGPADRN